ncbi:MAG: hypothetical protein QM758_19295 [Armatimonas sp.]
MLQKRLKEEFVAVSANTQDLQWHRSLTQKWFLELVKKTMTAQLSVRNGSKLSGQGPGNADLDLNRQMLQSNDPQGMYIVGADGTPYGFANDHDTPEINRLMNLGLKGFRAHPPRSVVISQAEKNSSFSITPPADAQVLQVFARIPAPPSTCSFLNNGVGRDFCWVYGQELQEVAQRAKGPKGSVFSLPMTLVRRIARFHLVDDVRGTPNMWEASEIQAAQLQARILSTTSLQLTGSFALQTALARRGYAGKLEGTLELSPTTGKWTRLRLLADGTAFGAGTYTPNQPPNPYRLLVGFLNTSLPEARIVPPEEVATYNRTTRYRSP